MSYSNATTDRATRKGPGHARVSVRPMDEADLTLVEAWLRQPHVARWWLTDTTVSEEIAEIRRRVRREADTATRMLTVCWDGRAVGWCQWYWWDDYPDEAADIGSRPGEAGIDYAIGEPELVGRGVGTEMIAALVRAIRRQRPGAGILVGPEEANRASRAVLERNGFRLEDVRRLASEPRPIAVYRLARETVRLAEVSDAGVVARLLDQFNREFDVPSPGPVFLEERIAELIRGEHIDVLLGGAGPDGLAVLCFRPSIWSDALECYLAELFVTPARRDVGLGRAMMEEVLAHARRRGANIISIGVDETDAAARHLYESVGFSNRIGGPDGPCMFFYEREL